MEEQTKSESKLDILKQAITDFVNVDVNELRDTEVKATFVDAFKTILKSEDSGVYAWLKEVLPMMKEKADAKGITLNPKEEFETEPQDEQPTEEETPSEETPSEETDAPEEVQTAEETDADAPEGEEVKSESRRTRGSILIEMANIFVD